MAKRLIFFVLALACVFSCFVLPSLAAIVPADYVEYPTLNAFPYPYEPQTGFMLNYITYPEDKSITFSGTPDGGFDTVRSSFILKDWQTGLNVTQKVTFSFKFGTLASTSHRNVKLRCQVVSAVGGTTYYDVTYFSGGYVSFDMAPTDKLNIYIRFESNVNIAPFKFYPVLNYGADRYPYQPYVNALLDDSYKEGEAAGRDQAFDDGVLEGLERAEIIQKTPFSDIRVDLLIVLGGSVSKTVSDIPFKRTFDGIYFDVDTENWLYANGYQEDLSNCDFAYVSVNFLNPVVYQTTPLMIVNASLIDSGRMYISDASGASTQYQVSADRDYSQPGAFTVVDGSPRVDPGYVTRLDIHVGRPNDLLYEFNLYSPVGSYDSGYLEGYKDGLSESEASSYDRGYAEGVKVGFADGKKEGLKTTEEGDWLSLFTAVIEAPVHAFQSLFNFELFGFDMRAMISSVLTISMFILILKKIGVL